MIKNREVELKLEVDPASIDLLNRASMLATIHAVEHEQTSTYFDTPEQALHKAGLSLRIRKIGTTQMQTVKAESIAAAGLFARPEWEMPIDGDHPIIAGHDMPFQTLIPTLRQDQLAAIFHIVVTRPSAHREKSSRSRASYEARAVRIGA